MRFVHVHVFNGLEPIDTSIHNCSVCVYLMCIYIYVDTQRERERESLVISVQAWIQRKKGGIEP